MPAKRVKIFETGNFLQGNFPSEKVSEIFNATTSAIPAQFAHTSKIAKANKEPVILGEFSKIELENDQIFGWLEFNEKGQSYYDDGIINGVSVEIANGVIDKIAVLPVGVNPQISGAEFEDSGLLSFGGELEFEQAAEITIDQALSVIENMPVDNLSEVDIDRLHDAVWAKSDEKRSVSKLIKMGYVVEKKPLEFEHMSAIEIEQAVKNKISAEFEAKSRGSAKFDTLRNSGVLTPAMEKLGLTREFMSALEFQSAGCNDRLEFSENTFSPASVIIKVLESMPPVVHMGKPTEFAYEGPSAAQVPKLTLEAAAAAAAERSKNM